MADKAAVVEPEETAVASQRLGKHASTATNQHATTENCWKYCLLWCPPRAYITRANATNICYPVWWRGRIPPP
jgi:hypothetical protein